MIAPTHLDILRVIPDGTSPPVAGGDVKPRDGGIAMGMTDPSVRFGEGVVPTRGGHRIGRPGKTACPRHDYPLAPRAGIVSCRSSAQQNRTSDRTRVLVHSSVAWPIAPAHHIRRR